MVETALALSGSAGLTDAGLKEVAGRCPALRRLELRGCAGVTAAGVFNEVGARCAYLDHLDLVGKIFLCQTFFILLSPALFS